jgi:hypothetical protein
MKLSVAEKIKGTLAEQLFIFDKEGEVVCARVGNKYHINCKK